MHIILGLLGALVTLLYLLNRLADMGFDLGGLNPFYWRRRRAWRKKYEGDPIHAVDDPREVAALLIIGFAKMDGEVSASQKQAAVAQFATTFSMPEREAAQLYGSSAHLLGHPQVLRQQLDGVLERRAELFNAEQAESLLQMAGAVVPQDELSPEQSDFIEAMRGKLAKPAPNAGPWTKDA